MWDIALPFASINPVWAYSDKLESMNIAIASVPNNFAYLRHATPLNMFRLFELDK